MRTEGVRESHKCELTPAHTFFFPAQEQTLVHCFCILMNGNKAQTELDMTNGNKAQITRGD